MPEHGTVLAVQSRRLGDELVGAHSAGATVLQVDDVADFSEEGGWISTPAGVQAYSTINDAASTISLTAGLLGALADADRVDLYDVEQAQTIVEVIASVQVDGAEVNSDPVEAIVHHTLVALLPEGIRAEAGESVEFEHDATADVSTITNVLGKSPSIDGAAVWNPYVIQAMNALTVPDHVPGEHLMRFDISNLARPADTDVSDLTSAKRTGPPAWTEDGGLEIPFDRPSRRPRSRRSRSG
jgi:hypothetical protein